MCYYLLLWRTMSCPCLSVSVCNGACGLSVAGQFRLIITADTTLQQKYFVLYNLCILNLDFWGNEKSVVKAKNVTCVTSISQSIWLLHSTQIVFHVYLSLCLSLWSYIIFYFHCLVIYSISRQQLLLECRRGPTNHSRLSTAAFLKEHEQAAGTSAAIYCVIYGEEDCSWTRESAV